MITVKVIVRMGKAMLTKFMLIVISVLFAGCAQVTGHPVPSTRSHKNPFLVQLRFDFSPNEWFDQGLGVGRDHYSGGYGFIYDGLDKHILALYLNDLKVGVYSLGRLVENNYNSPYYFSCVDKDMCIMVFIKGYSGLDHRDKPVCKDILQGQIEILQTDTLGFKFSFQCQLADGNIVSIDGKGQKP